MLGVPTPSFPATSSQQRLGSERNKVALRPGRSLMDWIKLTKSGQDLQGNRGRIQPVTLEELARHNTVDDCWMAIRGQVFNVTHYMEYHPGGVDELMKGAGIDATSLFDGVHKWVNFSSMLTKCYVGPLKYEANLIKVKKKMADSKNKGTFLVPTGIPSLMKEYLPRYEWYEKLDKIVVSVYIKQSFKSRDIIVDCEDGKIFDLKILFSEKYYRMHLNLEHGINVLQISSVTDKKIELILEKEDKSMKWSKLGSPLEFHNILKSNKERELKFRKCQITSIKDVTHDTKLYAIKLPRNCYFESPVGYHTKIAANIEGLEVQRNYTIALQSFDANAISNSLQCDTLYFMIKCYKSGALTPFLNSLKTGDMISMSDCVGNFRRSLLDDKSKTYLIAAGTGFTPMIRVVQHYLHGTKDSSTKLKLLFANKEEHDILWRTEIEEEMKKFSSRFNCTHILSKPNDSWTGLKGRITKEVLQTFIAEDPFSVAGSQPLPSLSIPQITQSDELFLLCGSDEFSSSMKSMLLELGFGGSDIHCFSS